VKVIEPSRLLAEAAGSNSLRCMSAASSREMISAVTWVRGDLPVQLVRAFHPFPKPPAKALPSTPVFGMAANPVHQVTTAFAAEPTEPKLHCANAICLLALKQAAFGRTRPTDNQPVERDYHDAYLLVSTVPDALVDEFLLAEYEVRSRAVDARRRSAPPRRT
jgi:hypothetical protein